MVESFRVVPGLPQEALTELIQLAGNFLCSDFPMDKLKSAVDKTIEGIAGIEGVAISPKELEKHLETIVWFIESRYSKSYEVSQSELGKIGKQFGERVGVENVWKEVKEQMKAYRRTLLNTHAESSGVSSQKRLMDFNYEFISMRCL